MPRYRHIWLNGPDGITTPYDIDYFDQAFAEVAPSHGDYDDQHILTDGNTGTWIDFVSSINAANPDFHDYATIWFDRAPQGSINAPSTAELVLYYLADSDMRFSIGDYDGEIASAQAGIGGGWSDAAEIGGGWRKARLQFTRTGWDHSNAAGMFVDTGTPAFDDYGWTLLVRPPTAVDDTATFLYNARISEVRLAIQHVSLVAPPCRNTGRDDWLGVGGARNSLSPKSQQGGFRNSDYY